jgi:hypothetical protein
MSEDLPKELGLEEENGKKISNNKESIRYKTNT